MSPSLTRCCAHVLRVAFLCIRAGAVPRLWHIDQATQRPDASMQRLCPQVPTAASSRPCLCTTTLSVILRALAASIAVPFACRQPCSSATHPACGHRRTGQARPAEGRHSAAGRHVSPLRTSLDQPLRGEGKPGRRTSLWPASLHRQSARHCNRVRVSRGAIRHTSSVKAQAAARCERRYH